MPVEIVRLSPSQVQQSQQDVLDAYRQAFALPPYERIEADVISFTDTLRRHSARDGFRFVAAVERPAGNLIGFAYGYTSRPGQWWHDRVTAAMEPEIARQWLSDAFEFVELAVCPEHHGRGYGGRLHDALLEGLAHRTAVLSTMQAETSGLILYRHRGWVTLLENFLFPGLQHPYIIMGKALK
ncbi:MAG: GNAT family N-acetyltransferase [Chloroflexi bacterium]|jgi:GNAT superfamily N-acetyltransferase|nr:GNAT family N-acetyltransferase [Chloroflexota bacterium]